MAHSKPHLLLPLTPFSVFRFHLSVFRAGSLHQFSLYEYAHITAGIVGEDGNGFAEVA